MKKYVMVFLICVSVINYSYSQETSNVKDSNDIGIVHPESHDFEYVKEKMIELGGEPNYEKVLNGLKEFKSQGDSVRYSWQIEFQEQVVDEYYQEVILFSEDIKTIGISKYGEFEMFLMNPYILKLIRRENQIIHIEIINSTNWTKAKKGNLKGKLIRQMRNEIKMKKMFELYYSTYGSELDFNALFKMKGSFIRK